MEDKVQTIVDFASSKSFEIEEEIISLVRNQIYEPKDSFIEEVKEKMVQLDFIKRYCRDDVVWNWSEEYYGYEDEEQ